MYKWGPGGSIRMSVGGPQGSAVKGGACAVIALFLGCAQPSATGMGHSATENAGQRMKYDCHLSGSYNAEPCDLIRGVLAEELENRGWTATQAAPGAKPDVVVELSRADTKILAGRLVWQAGADAPLQNGPVLETSVVDIDRIPESAVRSFVKSLFKVSGNDLSKSFDGVK